MQKNPVCEELTYRKYILDLMPNLNRLDGLPRSLSYLPNASELKDNYNIEFKLDATVLKYWYTENFPKVNLY